MKKLIFLLALVCALTVSAFAQSASDITVSGTLYNSFNDACTSCTFTVTVTRRDGVAVQSTPRTVTSHASTGAVSFTLPRKSFVTFTGNYVVGRYNWRQGISLFIPDQSTVDIVDLLSVEDAAAALVAVSSAPSDAQYIVATANGTLSAEQSLGALTTGLLKNTVSGSTGTLSTATAGTDYVAPGAITGAGLTQSTGKLLGRYSASTGAIQEITISTGLSLDGSGNLTASASGGGTWGSITGTLSAQTDLQTALDAKQSLDSDLTALAGNSTNGLWARTGSGTGSARTITGTADKITVTDGDGVAGNPTLTIASTYAGQNTITTLGTIATGTWNGSVIGSAYGGAGTVNGILKANGSGTVSAATSGTDYAAAGAITGSGQTMATGRLLGRTTASTGAVEEITPAATFSFTAGGLDVANLGITNAMLAGSIANAKLANSGVTIGSTSVSLGATASTIAGLTLTTPTIASFNNANHNHADSIGGGQLTTAALTGLGTGVATALGVNVGSAGAFVVNGGAGGTPSSITLTNGTGLPLSTGVTGDLPFANFVQAGSAGFVGATGAGDYSHRTPTQVTAALDAFVGDSGSGGTKGLVPAPTTGDATKYLKGDGTWATVSAGIAVGGAITSGTASRVLFENSSNQLGEAAGFTFDGTSALTLGVAGTSVGSVGFKNATSGTITVQPVTGALGTVTLSLPATTSTLACLACAQTFSAAQSFSDVIALTSTTASTNKITQGAAINIGTTSTDGIILQNTTAAAAGTQQYSPRLRLTGQGWKTNSTAASQTVDWVIENQPVQGAANPTSTLAFNSQINGGGYSNYLNVKANGIEVPSNNTGSSISYGVIGSGITGMNLNTGVGIISFVVGTVGNASVNQSGYYVGSGGYFGFSSSSSVLNSNSVDTYIMRSAAAGIRFGQADVNGTPVAQTTSVQSAITGTNLAGSTWTHQGSLGTSQGVPGRHSFTGGAMISASGSTQQTAVSRLELGATKVLTNNSATTIVNVTNASNTSTGGVLDYCVEVFDGTDTQYECGMATYGISNKAGAFSGNTVTKFGNHQNATSGTLTVTIAISAANPGVLSVNANSSLTPSTGYPRLTYSLRNLGQQAAAVQ